MQASDLLLAIINCEELWSGNLVRCLLHTFKAVRRSLGSPEFRLSRSDFDAVKEKRKGKRLAWKESQGLQKGIKSAKYMKMTPMTEIFFSINYPDETDLRWNKVQGQSKFNQIE